MSSPGEKTDFEWEEGRVLDEKNSDSIPEVRAKGLPKLKKAVHADPVIRKKERDKEILNKQSKTYKPSQAEKIEDEGLVVEESQSGLSENVEESAAKKLIDTGKQFKGLDRFGGKKKDKDQ